MVFYVKDFGAVGDGITDARLPSKYYENSGASARPNP